MKKFRLPRKIKKKLKSKIFLYPSDSDGNSLMAFPTKVQEDYTAYKRGELSNLLEDRIKNRKVSDSMDNLNKHITVSDKELKEMVDNTFANEYRTEAYLKLINDKTSVKSNKELYYSFINAYNREEYNLCCMIVLGI